MRVDAVSRAEQGVVVLVTGVASLCCAVRAVQCSAVQRCAVGGSGWARALRLGLVLIGVGEHGQRMAVSRAAGVCSRHLLNTTTTDAVHDGTAAEAARAGGWCCLAGGRQSGGWRRRSWWWRGGRDWHWGARCARVSLAWAWLARVGSG